VAFRELDIRDPQVQELLWKYLEPKDIRADYTKIDAILWIANEVHAGNQLLWGDETAMLRCEGNKFNGSISPHVMGDGKKLKALIAEGIVFAKAQGWKQITIWTTRGAIQRLLLKLKFEQVGLLPKYHLRDGQLADVAILRKEL
jgi:hypothetical protein